MSKSAASPEASKLEQIGGCAVLGILLASAYADWRLALGLIAATVVWSATQPSKAWWARAIHPLAGSWAIALCFLLPLKLLVKMTRPDESEPYLNTYERTLLDVARVFGHLKLAWGWTLVVLATLMLIAVFLPRAKPVSIFLTTTKWTGRLLGVVGVLSSFTFFAAVIAPGEGEVVLQHAQAVFDRGLAQEQSYLRQAIAARSVTAALATSEHAAPAFVWAEKVAEASHNDRVREELIQRLAGVSAPVDESPAEGGERLDLPGAAERLSEQRRGTEEAHGEFDAGFAQVLARTADLPRKEIVGEVLAQLVAALGADQSVAAEVGKALISNLTSEALRDRTKPIVDRLVAQLRDRFWSVPPAESAAAITREAEAIRGAHSIRASALAEQAASLATEAEKEMEAGNLESASWKGMNARIAAGEAQYEAALSQDVAGVGTPFLGFVSGLPSSFKPDPRLRELDAIVNRVEKVNAEIRPRVEAAHEAVEVRAP